MNKNHIFDNEVTKEELIQIAKSQAKNGYTFSEIGIYRTIKILEKVSLGKLISLSNSDPNTVFIDLESLIYKGLIEKVKYKEDFYYIIKELRDIDL